MLTNILTSLFSINYTNREHSNLEVGGCNLGQTVCLYEMLNIKTHININLCNIYNNKYLIVKTEIKLS